MALEYSIAASRYCSFCMYLSPLATYFCLRTLGSRLQAIARVRIRNAGTKRPAVFITPFLNRGIVCEDRAETGYCNSGSTAMSDKFCGRKLSLSIAIQIRLRYWVA